MGEAGGVEGGLDEEGLIVEEELDGVLTHVISLRKLHHCLPCTTRVDCKEQ